MKEGKIFCLCPFSISYTIVPPEKNVALKEISWNHKTIRTDSRKQWQLQGNPSTPMFYYWGFSSSLHLCQCCHLDSIKTYSNNHPYLRATKANSPVKIWLCHVLIYSSKILHWKNELFLHYQKWLIHPATLTMNLYISPFSHFCLSQNDLLKEAKSGSGVWHSS